MKTLKCGLCHSSADVFGLGLRFFFVCLFFPASVSFRIRNINWHVGTEPSCDKKNDNMKSCIMLRRKVPVSSCDER